MKFGYLYQIAYSVQKFDPAPSFLPIDLVLYNLAKRPPGEIKNNSGHISREAAAIINTHLQSSVGSDQSDFGVQPTLAIRGDLVKEAPWLAITDSYAEFVRSGQIVVKSGCFARFGELDPSQDVSVVVSSEGKDEAINDVAAVVLATGFESSDSLHFLPEDVLQTLAYDPNCSPLPLVLDINSTVHKDIPDLGFVGFYRGPFWGVVEMQSRFLGKLWTDDERAEKALASHVSPIPDLRRCYYESPKQLAQFPMGDYTYLMESLRNILGMEILGEPRTGPVLPSRYTTQGCSNESHEESITAFSAVNKIITDSAERGKFVAKAIFRSLQGDWKLERNLISYLATYPSGTFRGSANFCPRAPTDPGHDAEYLYVEEGDFETEQGLKFRASRRYACFYCTFGPQSP